MKLNGMIYVTLVVFCTVSMMTGCRSTQSRSDSGAEAKIVQDATPPTPQPSEAEIKKVAANDAPNIVITKDSHDFGDIGPGSSHKANYDFTNKGKAPLLVKNIQSTCGCSRPTLIKDGKRFSMPLKEPVAFEPGQGGEVEVTYKAGMSKGDVAKHLYIVSDDPETPRGQLTLKAKIVVKVDVMPEKVELRFDKENAGIPDLVVKSIDGAEFSIKSATVANNVITVPFDPQKKATEFTLKPEVDIEKLNQYSRGVVRITTTHPQAGTLLVQYNAKPMYEVSNPRYIIQNAEPGVSIFRDNLIKSNYGKKAEIESVTSRNGYMEIEDQQEDGDHIKLNIKITPPGQSEKSKRYITDEMTINLKDGHKLSIRCSGWFRSK